MPYLIIKNAETFFSFMQQVFGAVETARNTDEQGNLRHCELTVGESAIMYAPASEQFPPMTAGMFIYVDDTLTTYQTALEAGATTIMEPTDHGYGLTCGITDPYDNVWWVTQAPQS